MTVVSRMCMQGVHGPYSLTGVRVPFVFYAEELLRSLTPKRIIQELDKHVIGQDEAKRAVAIALRNRWRRTKVSEDVMREIMPKNILMIGPSGCGKTEIARRLAKIAKAPFLKVNA